MSDTEIQTPVIEDEEPGLIAYMFTNDRTQLPQFQQLLDVYYKGVFENAVGIMQAKHKVTGELSTLLVGVEHLEDGNTVTYPLARILSFDEASSYVGPDCQGGWLEDVEDEEEDELFH